MPTLAEVQQQIKALGNVDTFGTKKEIKHLPDVLYGDESVLGLTSGLMDGNTWLIVCTERRVIFLDKGMIYGLKQRETGLDKINSIEHKTGLVMGSIVIWDGASGMTIKNVMKASVKPFVDAVNNAIADMKRAASAPTPSAAPSSDDDVVSRLERLATLKERGIITDDEFLSQKAKILA